MTTQKTAQRWLASAAVLTLALAGCSKASDTTSGSSGGASGSDAISASSNDINAKSADQVGQGGTLRLANNSYPANWNTASSEGNESNTINISEAIQPYLYLYTADGKVEPNPEYTVRMEKKSDNPLTVEYELKSGLKWSDGTAMDYKSIENAFKYLDGTHKDYNVASSEGYNKVASIKKGANDQTAVVTFKEAYADWQGLFTVLPDALVKDAKTFNTGWVNKPLVTGGPYKIEKLDAQNKTVSLVPDPNWTGTKPKLNRILWTTIEDPAATATAYKNGQLDQIETSVPATYTVVKDLVGKGSVLRKAAGPSWTHITLNGAKGRALSDVKVRQAIQRGMNREELFQSVNAVMPYPKDMVQLNNHVLMTNQDGYKDNAGDLGKYDVDAAKKILTDDGYTFGSDGMATKNGKGITATFVYNDGSKTWGAVLPVLQEQMKAIGVNVQVQKVPPTDLFSKYVIPGQFDMSGFGWKGNPFLSSGDAIWKSTGEQNFGKTGTAEIDKLVTAAATETDPAKRLTEINDYDAKLWQQAGTIPLWQSYDFYVQNPDIANYGAEGFANITDWTKVGYVTDSAKLKS